MAFWLHELYSFHVWRLSSIFLHPGMLPHPNDWFLWSAASDAVSDIPIPIESFLHLVPWHVSQTNELSCLKDLWPATTDAPKLENQKVKKLTVASERWDVL